MCLFHWASLSPLAMFGCYCFRKRVSSASRTKNASSPCPQAALCFLLSFPLRPPTKATQALVMETQCSSFSPCSPVFQSHHLDAHQMSRVPPTSFSLHLLPPSHARSSVCGPQPVTHHDHNCPLSSSQGSSPLSGAVPSLGPSSSPPYLSCFFLFFSRETKPPSIS